VSAPGPIVSKKYVVTGTDTGVGKTIFAAALTAALGGIYWKPVQAGLDSETDSQTVARLSGAPVLPEAWRLKLAASPHRAAAEEGVVIDPDALLLPATDRPLVVEGAGGLMVPLNERTLYVDLFARWGMPLILCARTSLGTINHSLLSIAAIRARYLPLLGVAFIGEANPDSEQTICRLTGVKRLGRLGPVAPLDGAHLREAFAAGFDIGDFR
jgi:dethiobiotin synthetase